MRHGAYRCVKVRGCGDLYWVWFVLSELTEEGTLLPAELTDLTISLELVQPSPDE